MLGHSMNLGDSFKVRKAVRWVTQPLRRLDQLGKTSFALKAQREELKRQRDEARRQRDEARQQRDAFRAQRDDLKHQRDDARQQRDGARDQRMRAREHARWLEAKREELLSRRAARVAVQDRHLALPKRHFRIGDSIEAFFGEEGLESGRILEVGGKDYPYRERFSGFDYTHLDIEKTAEDVLVGDITGCPHIPDASFDAIISVDVFEHIDRPWLAAEEIMRLLKPGGLTYHSTIFSWRYHPVPIDFWRFTPDALRFLFDALEHVDSGFDDLERRRNIFGMGSSRIEPDAFGGWRENWRVFYAGRKPAAGEKQD